MLGRVSERIGSGDLLAALRLNMDGKKVLTIAAEFACSGRSSEDNRLSSLRAKGRETIDPPAFSVWPVHPELGKPHGAEQAA